jgi:carbonic anhydrase
MAEDELKRRFQRHHFPRYEKQLRQLVTDGQRPHTLFIGCSDSRVVPYLLMDAGPGEIFMVRNVGNLVPAYFHTDATDSAASSAGHSTSSRHDQCADHSQFVAHGTAAAVEFAVLVLGVRDIIVCGHSHCGAMRALYQDPPSEAQHLKAWLALAQGASLPVVQSEEALERVTQRNIVLQLSRLQEYPMVKSRMESGKLFLHGWYYPIDSGSVRVLDVATGQFDAVGPDASDGSHAFSLQ